MDVLIVEDTPEVRSAYGRVLEHAGYMVKAVDNGLAALAELQQRSYSVILLDIFMPFLEGRVFSASSKRISRIWQKRCSL